MKRSAAAVAPSQRFPRSHRLRKRSEFLALERDGRRRATADFVVFTRDRRSPPSRLGITTSRRVGHAPARSRVRRLVREVFRRRRHALRRPLDIVVIARATAATLSFGQVEEQLARAFDADGY